MKKEDIKEGTEDRRKDIRSDQGYKICEYDMLQGCLEFKHGRTVDTIRIDKLCEQMGLIYKG